jgi:hydroxymethylpyrimidine/phosphomethylpyrimidine kinase
VKGRVLIVAGSDSGGGAGIQADIKAVTALQGYAATAITALTAQDTRTVHAIHEVPPEFVRQQIEVVLDDIGADCIKTGMLHRQEVLEVVADAIEAKAPGVPVVVDPVMVAKGGARLLRDDTIDTLRRRLLPLARVLTPNLPEAEILAETSIGDRADLERAGATLLAQGPEAVLMKGGHMAGDVVRDVLVSAAGTEAFESPRIDTAHTHGTGCTLASAIAAGLAQGLGIRDAVVRARDYVQAAIRTAPGYGGGHGPLNHGHTVAPFPVAEAR